MHVIFKEETDFKYPKFNIGNQSNIDTDYIIRKTTANI